jgi:hypothetical protein
MALAYRNAALQVPWEMGFGRYGPTCQRSERRVLVCLYREHLVALHGFIKKTRTTPEADLAVARKRRKELER